jgi:hypothetical protein
LSERAVFIGEYQLDQPNQWSIKDATPVLRNASCLFNVSAVHPGAQPEFFSFICRQPGKVPQMPGGLQSALSS